MYIPPVSPPMGVAQCSENPQEKTNTKKICKKKNMRKKIVV
jgi:hypothetical protein